jgi:putative IMPACT (imprinted ancient) family translation regulator
MIDMPLYFSGIRAERFPGFVRAYSRMAKRLTALIGAMSAVNRLAIPTRISAYGGLVIHLGYF